MNQPLCAKLTDVITTQHVVNAARGPHYNLRACLLQRIHFSSQVVPADTDVTATIQVVTKGQHHPVDLKQNYKKFKKKKRKRKLSCNSYKR